MAEEQGDPGIGQREAGLPRWGWIGLAAAAGAVGLVWYQSHKASAATATQTTPTDTTTGQGLDTGQYETILSTLRDIQGNSSQPGTGQPSAPGSTFMFKITGDTFSKDAIYIGTPGGGYQWVPTQPQLAQYINLFHPMDLGSISQSDAQTRFGTLKPFQGIPT